MISFRFYIDVMGNSQRRGKLSTDSKCWTGFSSLGWKLFSLFPGKTGGTGLRVPSLPAELPHGRGGSASPLSRIRVRRQGIG